MRIQQFFFLIVCAFAGGGWMGFYFESRQISLKKFGSVVNLYRKSQENDVRYTTIPTTTQETTTHRQCEPHKHIMFMKTHKTASTATQNTLLRFAEKYKLQVGLSDTQDIRFHYAAKFKASFVQKTPRPIDMICHHMRFNYDEVKKVMPNDTIFFTIMRETSALFESTFDYMYSDSKAFKRVKKAPNSLELWLNHTNVYFRGANDGNLWWFAKNAMMFDLGFNNMNETEEYVNAAIKILDQQFQLVMISDYFDESMILLKDLLCWDFEDVLFLKTNARNKVSTTMTERLKKKILDWNKADTMLFNYFNKTFWQKVERYGVERMRKDVAHLNELNQELRENCVEGDAVPNALIKDRLNKVYNPKAVVMTGYNLKNTSRDNMTCVNLLKAEISFTFELKRRIQPPKIQLKRPLHQINAKKIPLANNFKPLGVNVVKPAVSQFHPSGQVNRVHQINVKKPPLANNFKPVAVNVVKPAVSQFHPSALVNIPKSISDVKTNVTKPLTTTEKVAS